MRAVFLMFFIFFIANACKKNSSVINTAPGFVTIEAGTYRASDIIYVADPEMYVYVSGHGFLTDITKQGLIQDYLVRHNAADSFVFQNSEPNNDRVNITFNKSFSFSDTSATYDRYIYGQSNAEDGVQINISSDGGINYKAYLKQIRYRKAAELFRPNWIYQESLGGYDSSTTLSIQVLNDSITAFQYGSLPLCQQIIEYYKGLVYDALLTCPNRDYPFTEPWYLTDSALHASCFYKPSFPVLYTNGKLKLPQMSCIISSAGNQCSYSKKNEWNYFWKDKALPGLLKEGDTIVVQQKYLYIEKK
ncbi:MAG: hypothetical protein QM763_01035 [Agriterribacter sp.]